jgi:hypothetical protein
MADLFDAAVEQLEDSEDLPFMKRHFGLVVINAESGGFDDIREIDNLEELLEEGGNDGVPLREVRRFGLRTQVIKDPGSPRGAGDRILQFFSAENQNIAEYQGSPDPRFGVIYEQTEEGDNIPLVRVSMLDMFLIVSGEGFAVPLPDVISRARMTGDLGAERRLESGQEQRNFAGSEEGARKQGEEESGGAKKSTSSKRSTPSKSRAAKPKAEKEEPKSRTERAAEKVKDTAKKAADKVRGK